MILTNTSDGVKTYVLPHETYCVVLGRCVCARPVASGPVRPVVLTLAERAPLLVPRAVLSVPEIAQALRRGRLRIHGEPS